MLNSNNIRFKNEFKLDSFKFNFLEITKWRFKSKRINLEDDTLTSELIFFTNDPYNKPQFFLRSKDFKGQIIDGKKIFKSKSTFVNFDDKVTIPIGSRTISDKGAPSKWGFGYDSKTKDGLFLTRTFKPLIKDKFKFESKTNFLLQRAFVGETNSFRAVDSSVISDNVKNDIDLLDIIGLDFNFESDILNSNFDITANFNSLNPNRLYDSFSSSANFLKSFFSWPTDKENCLNQTCENEILQNRNSSSFNSFFGVYSNFNLDNIYSSLGSKIINEYNYSKNNFSKSYTLIFDIGSFKGKSHSNSLSSLDRYSLTSSLQGKYKIYSPNIEETNYSDEYIYTSKIEDKGIFLFSNLSYAFSKYSDLSDQSILQASLGPAFAYGDLKNKFLDYTFLSLIPQYANKKGKSPFEFDNFNEDSRLEINFKQQVYGPIIIGFEGMLNLNNSSSDYKKITKRKYSIGISRRAYSVNLINDIDEEYFLLYFNINNFKYDKYSPSF